MVLKLMDWFCEAGEVIVSASSRPSPASLWTSSH
jgi:hypothetical protein